jgi:TonB family protein
MFQSPRQNSSRAGVVTSAVLHLAVLWLLLHRTPLFVQPSTVAWGRHGGSESIIYFEPAAEKKITKSAQVQLNMRKKYQAPKAAPEAARRGSENGSAFQGLASGQNAIPALPQVFPDPVIYPWQLSGVQGDVIVEVTIDEQGAVTETKLLQSVKREIDEKVIATLRSWRFRPATVDGVAISSRQDVHFHFPS